MEYRVPYAVQNRTDGPEWGRFALEGEIGRRIDLYNERGVKSPHAREEVFAEARSYFRDQQDGSQKYRLLQGGERRVQKPPRTAEGRRARAQGVPAVRGLSQDQGRRQPA